MFRGILLVTTLAILASAAAASTTWTDATGNWAAGGNWSGGVPGSGTLTYVNNGGTAEIYGGTYAYTSALHLGNSYGDTGYVTVRNDSSYSQLVATSLYVGDAGTGYFTQYAGSSGNGVSISGNLHIAFSGTFSRGTYTLNGGNVYADDVYVGHDGIGSFVQNGGTLTTSAQYDVCMGYSAGSSGTFHLGGGSLTVNDHVYVGYYSGYGRFEWYGGTIAGESDHQLTFGSLGTLAMGFNFDADNLMNGALVPLSGLNLATLEITNGAIATKTVGSTTCGVTYLRVTGGATASQTAGTVAVGQDAWIGDYGTGTYTQGAGQTNITGHLYVGNGGTGFYNLSGSSALTCPREYIGEYGGTGLFTQNGGSNTMSAYLMIGSGTYVLRGGTLSIGWDIGNDPGDGCLILDGGTLSASSTINVDTLILGNTSGRSGSYTQSGNTVTYGTHYVGKGGSGTYMQSSGTNTTTSLYVGYNAGSSGTYAMQGGTHNVGTVWLGSPGGAGRYEIYGGTCNVSGQIVGGAVSMLAVDGGTLNVTGTISVNTMKIGQSAAGSFTLGSGKVLTSAYRYIGLAGTGTQINNGGTDTVAAALSLGGTTVKGAYRLNSGSLHVGGDIVGAANGTFLYNGGTLTVDGGVNVQTFAVAEGGYTASYSLGLGKSLTAGTQFVGLGGTGTFTLAGGVNSIGGDLTIAGTGGGGGGIYRLTSGSLSVGGNIVGGGGSTLIQDGGALAIAGITIAVNTFALGDSAGTDVSFPIGAGRSVTASVFRVGRSGTGSVLQTGGTCSVSGTLVVGETGQGAYEFQGGTLGGSGGLNVRQSLAAKGVFQGNGTVGLTGALANNGQVVANGYGTPSTLNLSSMNSVNNPIENPHENGTNGWFARNLGRLELPAVRLMPTATTYNWGESSWRPTDPEIDLVNSVQMAFDSPINGAGPFGISLLDPARPDVPTPPEGFQFVGVWDFQPPTGLTFGTVGLTFRYDDTLASSLGLGEADLRVFHYDVKNARWTMLDSKSDVDANLITAGGLTSFSQYAVGVPEPVSLFLLVAGTVAMLGKAILFRR